MPLGCNLLTKVQNITRFLAIMFFNNKFPRRLIATKKRLVLLLNVLQKLDRSSYVNLRNVEGVGKTFDKELKSNRSLECWVKKVGDTFFETMNE